MCCLFNSGVMYAKPVGTVRPMQSGDINIPGGGIMMARPGMSQGRSNFPADALAKQGVSVQQITVPKGEFCLFSKLSAMRWIGSFFYRFVVVT